MKTNACADVCLYGLFPGCFVVTDILSLRMFCHHVGFATTDVLSLWLFCHHRCFVTVVVLPPDILYRRMICDGRFLDGCFSEGRFVDGCFVTGCFDIDQLFTSDILNQKHTAHTFELLAVRRISKLFDLNHRSWLSPRLLTCMLFRMILTVFFMFLKRLLCESTYFLT